MWCGNINRKAITRRMEVPFSLPNLMAAHALTSPRPLRTICRSGPLPSTYLP